MFSPSSSQWSAITVGIPLWLSTSSGLRCSSWSASHTWAWGGSSTTLYRPAPACTSCPAPWRGWPPLPSVPAQQHCSTSSAWTWSYTTECCTGCQVSTVVPNRVVKDEKVNALFNNCATYPLPSPHASHHGFFHNNTSRRHGKFPKPIWEFPVVWTRAWYRIQVSLGQARQNHICRSCPVYSVGK